MVKSDYIPGVTTQFTVLILYVYYQYFNVSSVRPSVCVCVTDVTSTNKPRLRENTREDRDVIICVHS